MAEGDELGLIAVNFTLVISIFGAAIFTVTGTMSDAVIFLKALYNQYL